jgi:hypothetical protein
MASPKKKTRGVDAHRGGPNKTERESAFKAAMRIVADKGWKWEKDFYQDGAPLDRGMKGKMPKRSNGGNHGLDKWLMHQGLGVDASQWPGPVPKDGYNYSYLGNDEGTPEGVNPNMPYYDRLVIEEAMRSKPKRPSQTTRKRK